MGAPRLSPDVASCIVRQYTFLPAARCTGRRKNARPGSFKKATPEDRRGMLEDLLRRETAKDPIRRIWAQHEEERGTRALVDLREKLCTALDDVDRQIVAKGTGMSSRPASAPGYRSRSQTTARTKGW